MATLGTTTEPTYLQEWTGINTNNQIGRAFTMPEAGRILSIGVWIAGYAADCSVKVTLWTPGGAVLASSALFTAVYRAFGVGNNDLYVKDLTTPYQATNGQSLWAGWARNPSAKLQWGDFNGGGDQYYKTVTGSWPAAFSGYSTDAGHPPGIYLVYETVPPIYVRRGGAWVQADSLQVRRASAWSDATDLQVRRGSVWIPTT